MTTANQSSYDYIVCGGGTAGCVVAARLTEDENTTVLLLEAGISDLDWPATETPALCASLQRTKVDWDFKCESQPFAYKGYQDVTWSKAKVLGGCSSHNYMCFSRGAAQDFDSWAENGCTGWSWKDVLPYFLKSENYLGPNIKGTHNKGGPLTITEPKMSAVSKAFLQAGLELGYKQSDPMSGDTVGFGVIPASIDGDGKRSSTSRAFIHPISERPNLTVLCESHVCQIEFKNKKAVGVHFVKNGEKKYAMANKEVIVSGGPINSPQILMLSGIGPKSHLAEFGIECIADLPVGQNLQDHVCLQMKTFVKSDTGAWSLEMAPLTTNGCGAAGFISSGLEPDQDMRKPDILVLLCEIPYPYGPDEPNIQTLVSEKLYPYLAHDTTRDQRMKQQGFAIFPVIMHPKSRGDIRLKTADPFNPPAIDPHYLEDSHDIKVMIEGIRISRRILEAKAMEKFECKRLNMKMPDSEHDDWSDENLEQFIRHFACTMYHPVGTCKMGANDDNTAVVDPELRVRGIEGLRVIDSSIIPTALSGPPNAPTIMIGEKGADMIKSSA